MSTTALSLNRLTASLDWSQTITVSGFNSSEQRGPLFLQAAPALGVSDANFVYPVSGTLAAGASITFNLFALTGLGFAPDMVPTRAYNMLLKCSGATWRYGPAAATGLAWFLSAAAYIQGGAATSDNNGFAFLGVAASTIDNGNKQVTLTNTHGSATLTYYIGWTIGQP